MMNSNIGRSQIISIPLVTKSGVDQDNIELQGVHDKSQEDPDASMNSSVPSRGDKKQDNLFELN